MKTYDVSRFNHVIRLRTKMFAVNVFQTLTKLRLNDLSRIPVKQLVRSASSVAANFSSATRGRSEAEFYSKICVVTEECDECLFWIDFLIETGIIPETDIKTLQNEADELLRIFSTIKRKLKLKRSQ
jgi:four helix bundle protein